MNKSNDSSEGSSILKSGGTNLRLEG